MELDGTAAAWVPQRQGRAGPDRSELVLLNTSAPSASFGADSRTVSLPRPPRGDEVSFLPDSPLLTPDGEHVPEEAINLRAANARPAPSIPSHWRL